MQPVKDVNKYRFNLLYDHQAKKVIKMKKSNTQLWNLYCLILVSMTIMVTAGCGGTEARNGISGTINLDGSPLAKGDILFRPAPGANSNLASGSAEIINGKYTLPKKPGLSPGEYTVRIIAEEIVPGKTTKVPSRIQGQFDEIPVKINLIPDEFGADSSQVVTVKNGKNVFNFDVPKRK